MYIHHLWLGCLWVCVSSSVFCFGFYFLTKCFGSCFGSRGRDVYLMNICWVVVFCGYFKDCFVSYVLKKYSLFFLVDMDRFQKRKRYLFMEFRSY